jgi:hypothetical protein
VQVAAADDEAACVGADRQRAALIPGLVDDSKPNSKLVYNQRKRQQQRRSKLNKQQQQQEADVQNKLQQQQALHAAYMVGGLPSGLAEMLAKEAAQVGGWVGG